MANKQETVRIITPRQRFFRLNLREVWQYRDLIWLLTRRSFVLTYKQTVLGPAWILLNPLLSSLLYAFVFGGIAKIATDGVPHILFYLCTGALWGFFSTGLSKNATAFTSNAHVFGKVYFPRLTVPVSHVLSAAIQFGIQMVLVLGFLAYYAAVGAVRPNWWAWLLIPLILGQLGLLGLGCGAAVSALTVKYRDLAILVTFGVQLWMYASPVVYPLSALEPGWMRSALLLNPVTAPMELFRYAVLGQGEVLPGYLALSAGITVLLAVLGILLFNRAEKTFMDTV